MGTFSFEGTAARLDEYRGISLRRMPPGVGGIMSEAAFARRLAARFSSDFEILGVHRALVDIHDDFTDLSREPVYVVERTGRDSHCFDFFHATSGRLWGSACGSFG